MEIKIEKVKHIVKFNEFDMFVVLFNHSKTNYCFIITIGGVLELIQIRENFRLKNG